MDVGQIVEKIIELAQMMWLAPLNTFGTEITREMGPGCKKPKHREIYNILVYYFHRNFYITNQKI